jgi:hypothetical protein
MTKRLIILLAAFTAVIALFQCSGGPASEEELQVRALEKGYAAASSSFLRALRTMGGTGLDTTSDVESAVEEIKEIRKELGELIKTLTEEKATAKAEELKAKIDEFYRRNEIE